MKLPTLPPVSTEFKNAPGSSMPEVFALAARTNPEQIKEMAETPQEARDLQTEALARQYVLIVDRSYSMTIKDGNGSRWTAACAAVEKLVSTIFRYDVDHNVPLYVFDHETTFVGELGDPADVMNVFREIGPRGSTDIAKALSVAMGEYAGKARNNFAVVPGTTFVVILDGCPNDGKVGEDAVKQVLRHFADPANGYIDNHTQIAVSFVQVGDDVKASRFLKELDDNLPGLDISDTKHASTLWQPNGIDILLHDAIFD